MMPRRLFIAFFAATALSLATAASVTAQNTTQEGPGAPAPGRDRSRSTRDLISAVRFWRMVDALGLAEDQVPPAMAKVKAMQQSEREFRTQRRETLARISTLLREEKPDEGKLREEVGRLRDAEQAFRRDREQHRDELLSSLSVQQQARFWVFEDEFPKHLQELREKARRGEGGRGDHPTGRRGYRRNHPPRSPP